MEDGSRSEVDTSSSVEAQGADPTSAVAYARECEERATKLLREAREYIEAMAALPPRFYAMWCNRRGDWYRDEQGTPYSWNTFDKAREALTTYRVYFGRGSDAQFEIRPFEPHYATSDPIPHHSLRTRVEKYWQLRCDYYDMWREDFDDLQLALAWIRYARDRIVELEAAAQQNSPEEKHKLVVQLRTTIAEHQWRGRQMAEALAKAATEHTELTHKLAETQSQLDQATEKIALGVAQRIVDADGLLREALQALVDDPERSEWRARVLAYLGDAVAKTLLADAPKEPS
jgi:hypothetical protein